MKSKLPLHRLLILPVLALTAEVTAQAQALPGYSEAPAEPAVERQTATADFASEETPADLLHYLVNRGLVQDLGPVSSAERAITLQSSEVRDVPGLQPIGIARWLGPRQSSGVTLEQAGLGADELPNRRFLVVSSPGARGVRLHFENFDVEEGWVRLWSEEGGALVPSGTYFGQGPGNKGGFWTATSSGDKVLLEITTSREVPFDLVEVAHLDAVPGFEESEGTRPALAELPCHLDVMCFDSSTVNREARDAVGRMDFMSGGQAFLCSGTILSDLDPDTRMPYFLTARHCLSTQAEVDTLQVTFLHQRNACGGTVPRFNSLPKLLGGTLLETSPEIFGVDMTFIRLRGTIPNAVSAAGWTTAPPPRDTIGIHHPGGTFKRVTFFEPGFNVACIPMSIGGFHIVHPVSGVTEGGSSGSPLLNQNGQVVGQLFGSCFVFGGSGCNGGDAMDAYGAFDRSFPQLRRWLEIGGTINVNGGWTGLQEGTPASPFRSLFVGYTFAWDESRLRIQSGTYSDRLTLSKKVTLLATGGPVTIGR